MTYPVPDPTATAVQREAAWLQVSGDSLPSLLASDGGPWTNVQAYWPGSRVRYQQSGIYVTRTAIADAHPMAQRFRPRYAFRLKLVWPVLAVSGIAETEQGNLDAAVGLLLQRIRGPLGDKTHGGSFLSVAETPQSQPVQVTFDDPEVTIENAKQLRATVSYSADDLEFNG